MQCQHGEMRPDRIAAERSATTTGLITLPIGLAAVVVPHRASRLLHVPARGLRVIGVADLALVPGLLAGRRRSRWLIARAALNLAIAGYCLRFVRRERAIGAGVAAGAMMLATAGDSRTIIALHDADSAE